MPTGKNKLMRYMRLYAGGYNLSGDARTFGALMNAYEGVDMTGWSDTVKNYLADLRRQAGVEGFQALMNDATAGAYTALNIAGQSIPVSVLLGGGAAPTYGDIAYLLAGVQMTAPLGWDGQAAALTADFLPDAGQQDASSDNPFGVVLYPETSIAATTNGAAQDNGAATANGAHANLHVPATASGNWSLLIQHSTTGAFGGEETTLMSFTINGSAIAAQHRSASGTVNRYTRFRAVRTAGTTSFVCALARN